MIGNKNTTMTKRVLISPAAEKIVNELRKEHGELMFHQSGGCCDGSQPMCFPKNEFKIGSGDVCLGIIAGCGFWMSKFQFEYWEHTQLTVDITEGRGSSFSIEIPMGLRFFIRSRLFTEEESNSREELTFVEQ